MDEPSLAEVYHARSIVTRYLAPTPLLRNRQLSERLECDLWVKYENCTPIRSFKARGGIYRAASLGADITGLVSASTGNHGQGIALGAKHFNRRAVIVVPQNANPDKVAAIRALDADIRFVDGDLAAANEAAREIAATEDLLYVEDGEDRAVMIGCATLATEIIEQLPTLDDLVLPVGGGNLIAACAFVLETVTPKVRTTGVQSDASPAVFRSWEAGKTLDLGWSQTFAGGLATSYPGSYTFEILRKRIDTIRLVGENDLVNAAMTMLRATGHLPEGAGAAALAGILADPVRYRGRQVVVLLSGSNAEATIWEALPSGISQEVG
jgi:threonine dehydratase